MLSDVYNYSSNLHVCNDVIDTNKQTTHPPRCIKYLYILVFITAWLYTRLVYVSYGRLVRLYEDTYTLLERRRRPDSPVL